MLIRAFVLLMAMFLVLLAAPASADEFFGRAECGTSGGPGCSATVESETAPRLPSGPAGGGPGSAPSPGGSPQRAEAEVSCEDPDPLTQRCTTTASSASTGGGGDDAEEVDFEAVAYAARADFSLPSPVISMSPSGDTPILVQVPVWMWIASDAWGPEAATATVPGGSVTVSATPTDVSWQMGDGTTVSCDGPGTAYNPRVHDPAAESPDCGHTYTATSAENEVTAAVSWAVSWSSTDGDGGDLPALVTESSQTVRVIESSGVVT